MAVPISVVEVENLTCERGGRRIFRNLSFAVSGGQCLTLEGPNGVGKSSCLRIIAGFLPQAAGEVRVQMHAGYQVSDPEERSQLCGWVAYSDGVKAQLTVVENARYFAALFSS